MRGSNVKVSSIRETVTGLPGERIFEVILERKVALARRTLKPLSIVLFKIDRFSSFALYLQEQAMRVSSRLVIATLRDSDTVCHVGPGVIGAILDETSESGAVWAADRIRRAALDTPARDVVSLSAGVACYPSHSMDATELLTLGAAALESALVLGPSRIEVATIL